jgi:hypothetical protein
LTWEGALRDAEEAFAVNLRPPRGARAVAVAAALGEEEAYLASGAEARAWVAARQAGGVAEGGERMRRWARASAEAPGAKPGRLGRLELALALRASQDDVARRVGLADLVREGSGSEGDAVAQRARLGLAQATGDALLLECLEEAAAGLPEAPGLGEEERLRARRLNALGQALRGKRALPPSREVCVVKGAGGEAFLARSDGRVVELYRLDAAGAGEGPVSSLRRWTLPGRVLAMSEMSWDGTPSLGCLAQARAGIAMHVFPVDQPSGQVDQAVGRRMTRDRVVDVAFGDINGDGNRDMAVALRAMGTASFVILGGTQARLINPWGQQPQGPERRPYAFSAVGLLDLDGDERDELVFAPGPLHPSGRLEVFAFAADGSLEERGGPEVGPVSRIVPLQEGTSALVVVDHDPDEAERPGRPPHGRDEVVLLGADAEGVPQLLGRWSPGPPGPPSRAQRALVASLDAFWLVVDEEVWVGRTWRTGEAYRLEFAPLSRIAGAEGPVEPAVAFRGESLPDAWPHLRRARSFDCDGDGDPELLIGQRLLGLAGAPSTPWSLGEPRAVAAERSVRLAEAAERLRLLGHEGEAEADFVAELRSRYPGTRATDRALLGGADALLARGEAAASEAERAFALHDAEAGRAALERAAGHRVAAAEALEALAQGSGGGEPQAGECWSRAARAWALADDWERAAEAAARAAGSPGLGLLERRQHEALREEALARAGWERLDLSFGRDAPGVVPLRPLRARADARSTTIVATPEGQSGVVVPVSVRPRGVAVEALIDPDGPSWATFAQVGVFEVSEAGRPTRPTGVELGLWSHTQRLGIRPIVRGRRVGDRLEWPSFEDPIVVRVEVLPTLAGSRVQLQVRSPAGVVLHQVTRQVADRGLASQGTTPVSMFAGVVSPAHPDVGVASGENNGFPHGAALSLERLTVEAPRVKRVEPRGLYAGHAALGRGAAEEAEEVYRRLVHHEDPRVQVEARFQLAFARGRRGDPRAHEDLVEAARLDPHWTLLRLETTGEALLDAPEDLAVAGAGVRALAGQRSPLLRALGRQLLGDLTAWTPPREAKTLRGRRAQTYLGMRRVGNGQRWGTMQRYQALAPGVRLPRHAYPLVLNPPAEPLSQQAFEAELAGLGEVLVNPRADRFSLAKVFAGLWRLWYAEPLALQPPMLLSELYLRFGVPGTAEGLLRRALRLDHGPEGRVALCLALATLELRTAADERSLRWLEAAAETGSLQPSQLEGFRQRLGGQERFERLLGE